MSSRQIQRLGWLVLLVVVAACKNNSLPRVSVQGNVTLDGAPVQRGIITFRPASKSKGPSAGGAIVDGAFDISAEKGPTAGPHQVEIKIANFVKDASKSNEPALAMRAEMQFKTFSQHVDVSTEKGEFHFAFTSEPAPSRH